jgi:hypothetical protein
MGHKFLTLWPIHVLPRVKQRGLTRRLPVREFFPRLSLVQQPGETFPGSASAQVVVRIALDKYFALPIGYPPATYL